MGKGSGISKLSMRTYRIVCLSPWEGKAIESFHNLFNRSVKLGCLALYDTDTNKCIKQSHKKVPVWKDHVVD